MDSLILDTMLKSLTDDQLSILEKGIHSSLMDLNNERFRRGNIPPLSDEEKMFCLQSYFKAYAKTDALRSYQERNKVGLSQCRIAIEEWLKKNGLTNEQYDVLFQSYSEKGIPSFDEIKSLKEKTGLDFAKLMVMITGELESRKKVNEEQF